MNHALGGKIIEWAEVIAAPRSWMNQGARC
jgi:hypothetical protein